jgi:ubiquinone biosynthesis protein Coq4
MIKINYGNTNKREYYLLKFLNFITPLHTNLVRKNRVPWCLSTTDLLNFPAGTLGNSLGVFLHKHHLEPVAKAERHDCFHVLLNYGTSMKEETKMQWFLVGTGKLSLFTIGSALLALAVLPENFKLYWQALKQGRQALNIDDWDFFKLLHCNTQTLQNLIFNGQKN